MNCRGLVLVPEFRADLRTGRLELRNVGSEPMEQAVKERLPYWDKFDIPNNPIISIGLSPDLEFLVQEGILKKLNFPRECSLVQQRKYGFVLSLNLGDKTNEVNPGNGLLDKVTTPSGRRLKNLFKLAR